MATRYRQTGTIYAPQIAFASIRWLHRHLMFDAYDDEAPFRDFITGIQRKLGRQVIHIKMAKVEDIVALLDHCDRDDATPVEIRLGVIVSLMLATCSRKADCLRLTATCIWEEKTHFVIFFVVSKTDTYRMGHYKYISKSDDQYNVCNRLVRYLKRIGLYNLPRGSPYNEAMVFGKTRYSNQLKRSVFCTPVLAGEGFYLSTTAIDASFRAVRLTLALSKDFVLHGIRVFVGTAQFRANVPEEQIHRSGNWVSSAMEQYLEPSLDTLLQSSEVVSRTAPMTLGVSSTVPPPTWWPTSADGPGDWIWDGGTLDMDIADVEA